ncbi:MAG: bifunctional (p)ppGpp synthetase/guanosine-3',5'-bis(diphosphate) 3'-pyrophosphohydrolase, partial [Bacteroidetes bacterium]
MTLPSPPPDGGLTYETEVKRAFQRLLRAMPGISRNDKQNIRRAFDMANQAHMGVRRKSGEPYILHPLAVAYIVVKEMGLVDPVSVICALLHDVVEDTDILLDEIRRKFDNHIASIVDGLTKITTPIDVDRVDSEQAENFRKLFLTISSDIRVVLIKLADRLHNMRTLGAMKPEKMLKIASETLYIYAPLAHRFGLYEIKIELEDLAFKYSQPRQYDEIQQKLKEAQMDGKRYIQAFIHTIRQALATTGLKFHILSRYKSIYSIYSKMIRKNLPFEEVYDIYAIRIILESREGREGADCWQVYGVISGIYRPIPKRLRDWITVPKENHYESLHTTVQGPRGKQVEVQIRTSRMDEIAEKGVAAHWKYKENGEEEDFLTEWIGQLRETLKDPDLNALETLREFRE